MILSAINAIEPPIFAPPPTIQPDTTLAAPPKEPITAPPRQCPATLPQLIFPPTISPNYSTNSL